MNKVIMDTYHAAPCSTLTTTYDERYTDSVLLQWSELITLLYSIVWLGEDPLIDDQNEHDINSVAGVLKLYFRGLENPLFPKERFLDLMSTISEYTLKPYLILLVNVVNVFRVTETLQIWVVK